MSKRHNEYNVSFHKKIKKANRGENGDMLGWKDLENLGRLFFIRQHFRDRGPHSSNMQAWLPSGHKRVPPEYPTFLLDAQGISFKSFTIFHILLEHYRREIRRPVV
jgi:hypothetical protein